MKEREIINKADKFAGAPRHDALIFDPRSLHEFGASETGPVFEGVNATKWVHDSHKLVKALHDMLSRFHRLVGQDSKVMKDMQMVGLVTSGELPRNIFT